MAEPQAGLGALQTWLLGRITAGMWAFEGASAESVIRSSNVLSADERLGIYATSYVSRLAECLRAEFPVLRLLVGDQVFNLFAGGYLSARSPTSYSLYDLGAGFPDYLESSRPRPHTGPGTLDALPASLARLERGLAESGRAEGPETSGGAQIDLASLLLDPVAPLHTPRTLRLLRLDFDLLPALAEGHAGRRPDPPAPTDVLVAVARSGWRVRAHPIEPWAFAWLQALGASGDRDAAIEAAADASGEDAEGIVSRLVTWLPYAAQAGFVVRAV
jgi:hypothetical protein